MAQTDAAREAMNFAFRNYVVQGLPSSGPNDPDKGEIRSSLGLLADSVDYAVTLAFNAGTTIVEPTRASLLALPGPFTAGARAEVRADPAGDVVDGNGIYRHNGTTWVWLAPLIPQDVIDEIAEEAREAAGSFLSNQPHAGYSSAGIFFGLTDPFGKFCPVMDNHGRLVQTSETGEAERVATTSELGGLFEPTFTYVNGLIPVEAVVDFETRRILSFWTADQRQYRLNRDGSYTEVTGGGSGSDAVPLTYRAQTWTPFNRTAIHTAQDEVCYIRVLMGQSLAAGQTDDADTIIADTAIYPDHAFMLNGSGDEGPRRLVGMGATAFTPLIETDNGDTNPNKETAASAWANTLTREVEAATGRRITTLTIVAAQGAQAYAGLKRGQPAWTAFLQALDQAVTICAAQGLIPVVTAGAWLGSEGDADTAMTTPTTVERQMQQLARQFAADVQARTGQAEPPVMLVCQAAYTPAADIWMRPVQEGAMRADGHDGIRLVGPHYQHPYSDAIHMDCRGYNRMGQDLARAELAEWFGTGARAIRPANAYWSSATEIIVHFDAPTYPMVIDASGDQVDTTGLTASAGFVFDDRSGSAPAITSVAVDTNRSLKITLASAPTGASARLGYAIQRTSGTSDGPVTGARGLVRDSTSVASLYDAVPARNWCPAFILEIGKF